MLATLLAVTLALPASGEASRAELTAAGQLDLHALAAKSADLTGAGMGAAGSVGVTVFGRRLVDDDAAPTLQEFLQRAPRFHVEGGGGGASIRWPIYVLQTVDPSNYLLRFSSTNVGGHGRTWADGYIV
jgi:hypothetical protein